MKDHTLYIFALLTILDFIIKEAGLDEKGKMCSQRCPKSNVSSVKVPKESEENIPYIGPLFSYNFLKVSL